MWEEILKVVTLVYLPSMLKFIFGPIGGYAAGLNMFATVLGTVAGTMTVVLLFSFCGDFMRKSVLSRLPRKRRFSERNRRFVSIWKKYGIVGVAALTPAVLTPIGGTLLAISFGTPKDKLIVSMFISASVWSLLLSGAVYFFGNEILPDFIK